MKNLFFLGLMCFLFSCGQKTEQEAININAIIDTPEHPKTETSTTTNTAKETTAMLDFYGYYVGMFNAEKMGSGDAPTWENKINISIDKIEGETISGHSVVAGNDRPFSGTITKKSDDTYVVVAKEPGDDKYDGVFSFTLLPNKIKGIWDANNPKISVIQRSYDLEKMAFTYNPELDLSDMGYTDLYGSYDEKTDESEFLTEDVNKKNPSKEALTKADVENMKKGDLEVMRNSIYARHGYSFKNRRMRYIFNYVDWYIPVYTDIRDNLTDLEKKNIDLIKRYEQHAERYYDSFGR